MDRRKLITLASAFRPLPIDFLGSASVTAYLSCARAQSVSSFAPTSTGALTTFAADTLRITDIGLLIEEARTNSLLRSQDFASTWNKLNGGTGVTPSLTANFASQLAPDGTQTATRIQFNIGAGTTSSDFSLVRQSVSSVVTSAMASLYLTSTTGTQKVLFYLNSSAGTPTIVEYTLTQGVWTRVSQAQTVGGVTAWLPTFGLFGPNSSNGTADIVAWGGQLEIGSSFATSYIPTVASTVTRAADNISLIGNADLIARSGAGWAVVETGAGNYVASGFLLGGSGANDYYLRQGSGGATTIESKMGGAAAATATIGGSASVATDTVKSGVSWNSAGLVAAANNGSAASVAQALSLPATVYLGGRNGSSMSTMLFRKLTLSRGYIGSGITAKTA